MWIGVLILVPGLLQFSDISFLSMVGYGKKLRELQIQEWKGYYINYKLMKKKVKRYVEQMEVGAQNRHNVLRDFSMLLDNQIEKIVLFLLEQQGVLAHRLSDIGQEHHALFQQPNSIIISELQEAYRDAGRDLLRLLNFVEMNVIGLRKILKKFDKRFGYKFTDYYVKTRANHPYSQLRQVFRHVYHVIASLQGIGAVVGVLSHGLADLQDLQQSQGSYISIYDQPSYSHQKAYDRVPREILWKALEKKGVRVAYIRTIQDMYDRVSTSVRTQGGESDDFPITIGLHQGSTLSPYLFTLILDVLTEQIQEIAPRCMFFADDIVLLGESREELNERLETWRRALETHGFRLSRNKSEYMECKFNKRRRVSNSEVKIGDHIIPQVTRFKYLGSVIQDDGEIEGDVNHRIQAGWMKWRKASGVLCDAKVPIKLKGKFYRTAVRPAILYGTECWAVKSQYENKVGVAEMRMLRWMCGKTRQDKIRNEAIRERVGVAPIVEKMVEIRLRWFGHVERRPVDSVVRRVDQMERRQTIRGRGRPKKTIREDPILDSIKEAVDRLSNSTNFLQFLGRHAFIMQEELPSPSEDHIVDERYHFMSLLLNLANTFLYMVNTYIIVPTADNYTLSLGAAASVCGVVIGTMAVAQVFSSVYFSAWSNRSYLRPLVFSSIVLLIGNMLYALAFDMNSIVVLLMGRLFCGLGSARAVNRRYISDCVPLKLRMQASAGFVSASALGMACGPALACLLQKNFRIYKFTMNQDTLPGWVMALAWLVYLLWLWICFKEPAHENQGNLVLYEADTGPAVHVAVENEHTQPLLTNSEAKEQDEDGEEENDNAEETKKPVTSIVVAYKLLTPSVKVQLFVYFMLKYAMEIILAESSLVTEYYFIWTTSNVSIFLACLGLTVLPVNIVVGNYISNMFEERQVLLTSEIMVCIGLLLSFHIMIPYSVTQYVGSALITFVSAEVLEGVNLSLLSKMMSSRLSRGTFNGGLLSTEAGTLARVIADGTITISGYFSESKLLNTTLLPALLICISSIIATCYRYNSLY
ncbi:SPX domain-containing membrane protein [Glycine soja]